MISKRQLLADDDDVDVVDNDLFANKESILGNVRD